MEKATARALPLSAPLGTTSTVEVGVTGDVSSISRATWTTVIPIACVAMLVGATVRLVPVLYSSFPLGDGGMFFVMVREIISGHFALPLYTSYDARHIPFDYPPIGLYLVAAIHVLTGWSILGVFRILPAIFAVLSIGAFTLLARTLLQTNFAVAIAAFTFALDIDSFEWQIKGGGITRSPGFFFAILFLWQLAVLYRSRKNRYIISCGMLAALTALTHLEWTFLIGASMLVFFAIMGRSRAALLRTVALVGVAGVLVAPWFLAVVARHGLGPFIGTLTGTNAASPWYVEVTNLLGLRLSVQPIFSVPIFFALLGAIALAARGRWFLPAWFAIIFLFATREPQGNASIVLALLAGVGAESVLLPLVTQFAATREGGTKAGRQVIAVALALLAFQSWLATSVDASQVESVLTGSQLASLRWVASHTPPDAKFVVVTGTQTWGQDNLSEWFYAIARRPSVTTVQGTEWLSREYLSTIRTYTRLQTCATKNTRCIQSWLRSAHTGAQYLYVSRVPAPPPDIEGLDAARYDCCAALRESLNHDPAFRVVYVGKAGAIYRILTPVSNPKLS